MPAGSQVLGMSRIINLKVLVGTKVLVVKQDIHLEGACCGAIIFLLC